MCASLVGQLPVSWTKSVAMARQGWCNSAATVQSPSSHLLSRWCTSKHSRQMLGCSPPPLPTLCLLFRSLAPPPFFFSFFLSRCFPSRQRAGLGIHLCYSRLKAHVGQKRAKGRVGVGLGLTVAVTLAAVPLGYASSSCLVARKATTNKRRRQHRGET